MEQISLFDKTTSARPIDTMSIRQFLKDVKSGRWKPIQKKVSTSKDDERKRVKKFQTPAVTISGTYENGRSGFPTKHTGYICIDIDGKDNKNVLDMRTQLEDDPYVFACFTSVSGNGLALLFKIKAAKHYELFNGIQAYLYEEYGISVDKGVKDPARLRYVSYDPKCYSDFKKKTWVKAIASTPIPTVEEIDFDESDLEFVVCAIEKQSVDIVPNYIEWYNVGQALATLGEKGRKFFHRISKIGESYDKSECDWQFDQCIEKEKRGTPGDNKISIGSVFFYAKEFGVNLSAPKIKRHTKKEKTVEHRDRAVLSINGEKLKKSIYVYHIWEFKVTFTKDEGVHIECHGLNNEAVSDFLYNQGIRKSGATYFHIADKIVEIITWDAITDIIVREGVKLPKDFYVCWDDESDQISRKSILNEVQNTGRRAMEREILLKEFVPENENFFSDTKEECYFFFRNGVVEVSKKGFFLKPFDSLDGYVWKEAIIDKDFRYVKKRSLIREILENAIGVKYWPEIQSAIGYMMHTFIYGAGTEMLFCIDRNVGDLNEGGNGKDFFSQVLSNMRRLVVVPGKSLNIQHQFSWEKVNRDTQIVWIEDLGKHIKMEQLYNLNNGIHVRKMHTNPFVVKAKVGCSLQHLINIEGSSDQRRQVFLLFTDFYSKRGGIGNYHKDRDIFGEDWKGWDEYYSMIVDSVTSYFKYGVKRMPMDDLIDLRRQELSDGTFETMEQGVWYSTEAAIKLCWGEDTIINTETFIAFKRKLAQWCKLSGLVLESERKVFNGKQQKAIRVYSPMKIVHRKRNIKN